MDPRTQDAFGEWLGRYDWDYFGTFTFSMPRRSSAIAPVARWWRYASSITRQCVPAYARAFIADEFHRDGERFHAHALLYSDPQAWQDDLWGTWRKHWGRERILRFDPAKGAAHYCAKYMLKESRRQAEWRFVEWHEGQISDGSDLEAAHPYPV